MDLETFSEETLMDIEVDARDKEEQSINDEAEVSIWGD